jgi:hypothetical protein
MTPICSYCDKPIFEYDFVFLGYNNEHCCRWSHKECREKNKDDKTWRTK